MLGNSLHLTNMHINWKAPGITSPALLQRKHPHSCEHAGQDDWWRILRPDCLSAEAGCAHSYSSCAESIEQAQVASQACRPVEYTRTNRQYLQQQDEGRLA